MFAHTLEVVRSFCMQSAARAQRQTAVTVSASGKNILMLGEQPLNLVIMSSHKQTMAELKFQAEGRVQVLSQSLRSCSVVDSMHVHIHALPHDHPDSRLALDRQDAVRLFCVLH